MGRGGRRRRRWGRGVGWRFWRAFGCGEVQGIAMRDWVIAYRVTVSGEWIDGLQQGFAIVDAI